MRIPRRYIIPLVVFLFVRFAAWGFEAKHRSDVQEVFDSAERNGWPVLLLYNSAPAIDYACRIFTLDTDPSGVWMGPGLQGYSTGTFIEGGSIIGLTPGRMELLRIDPPHFSPRPIRAHPLSRDGSMYIPEVSRFDEFEPPSLHYSIQVGSVPGDAMVPERYGIDQNRFEYWMDLDQIIVNDLLTREKTALSTDLFRGWEELREEIEASPWQTPDCLFSADGKTMLVSGFWRLSGNPEYGAYFWKCNIETAEADRIMTENAVYLSGVGYDGNMFGVEDLNQSQFRIRDIHSGEILSSFECPIVIGKRWVAERCGRGCICLYDSGDSFRKQIFNINLQGDTLTSIYEP